MTNGANVAISEHSIPDPILPQASITPQYWADQVLWRSYKAALAFAIREERRRCRQIIISFEKKAPESFCDEIRNLIRQLDRDQSCENMIDYCLMSVATET